MKNQGLKLRKSVIITMPDGTEKTYVSQSMASKEIGLEQSVISRLCRGKIESAGAYKARFAEVTPGDQETGETDRFEEPISHAGIDADFDLE